jgi:hypothetical protein
MEVRRHEWAKYQSLKTTYVCTRYQMEGDQPVHDSEDQVLYTYAAGRRPFESIRLCLELLICEFRSTYLRLGGYNCISHFREHGSLSELHFYSARLTDAQEAHLLNEMNTKWKDVA